MQPLSLSIFVFPFQAFPASSFPVTESYVESRKIFAIAANIPTSIKKVLASFDL